MSWSKRQLGMYDDLAKLEGYGDDSALGQAMKRMVEGPPMEPRVVRDDQTDEYLDVTENGTD